MAVKISSTPRHFEHFFPALFSLPESSSGEVDRRLWLATSNRPVITMVGRSGFRAFLILESLEASHDQYSKGWISALFGDNWRKATWPGTSVGFHCGTHQVRLTFWPITVDSLVAYRLTVCNTNNETELNFVATYRGIYCSLESCRTSMGNCVRLK